MRTAILFTCLFLIASLRAEQNEPSKDFANFKRLAAGIEKASALMVYAGTPHPMYRTAPPPPGAPREPERKKVKIHGEEFYEQAHVAGKEEIAKLKTLATNEANFSKWVGAKACGGFHADYCLEWKDGHKVYQMMLCFGCDEAKIYGPETDLYANVNPKALKAFSQVLETVTKGK